MHLSGRFVKSNDGRLSGLRTRGAVSGSHACAIYVSHLRASYVRQSGGPYVRQSRATITGGRLVCRRFCLKKTGSQGQQRVSWA